MVDRYEDKIIEEDENMSEKVFTKRAYCLNCDNAWNHKMSYGHQTYASIGNYARAKFITRRHTFKYLICCPKCGSSYTIWR